MVGSINDIAIERGWYSLAELAPEARSKRGGVVPGKYPIELVARGVTTRYEITARD